MTPEQVNAIALVLFVAGVVLGFGSTFVRLVRLHRAGIDLPRLIWRDIGVFGLLSVTFLLVAVARVQGWQVTAWPDAARIGWTVATASPAVLAAWIYVFYELRVIGHRRDGRDER
jgi:hypothetical protein